MPEEIGSTKVERVRIDIDAPASKLVAQDSGLNVAIRKLSALDRLVGRVEKSFANLN